MVEIVASMATQMVHDLMREENLSYRMIETTDRVMELVSVARKIQFLLKNGGNSERVVKNIWKIRYLAYGIEDVLETCAVEVAFMFQKHEERCIKRLFRRYFGVRNDGVALENVRAKISDIEPQIKVFNQVFPDDMMESIPRGEQLWAGVYADGVVRLPRQMYPHGVEEHFVGRDDDLKQLEEQVVGRDNDVKQLEEHFVGRDDDLKKLVSLVVKEEKEQDRVISIWGDKGLGKTTIARKVYNHPEVRHRFQAFAWVTFSQECEIAVLLQDILRQLGSGKVKDITQEKNVINHLWEIQRRKNCFIVLDSVWKIDQWKQISSGFEMGTRILITTREPAIANVGIAYKLRLLNEDEAWELLKKHAFPRKNGPDFGMLPILGKEIVRKCGYLPLAISSVGRRLTNKISLSEWQNANNDIAQHMQSEAEEELVKILEAKYNHLTYYSKQCFLYLGMFKENKDIDAEDLIFLWMGEGMIPSVDWMGEGMIPSVDQGTEGKMMDIAEYYLGELAFSGMLEVQEVFSATRRFMVCRLQNHSRELSLHQGEKEDFRLKVIDFCDGKQPTLHSSTLSDGTRRLVIHFNKQVKLWTCDPFAMDDLRSLLFLNSDQRCIDIPLRISDFRKLKLLRVLKFVRCKFAGRKLPKGIDKLVNLWYLGLLYCDLEELPSSISSLRNLRVLYIRVYDSTQMTMPIPDVLSPMVLLKHLRLPDYSDHEQMNKLILKDLLELETLVGFNSLIHDISDLSNLKKLRHLVAHAYSNDSLTSTINFITFYGARIRTNLYIEHKCNFTSPEGLDILEEVLMCPNLHALTLTMVLIYKFPDCGMHFSSDLTQLKLIGCKIMEDPMEALGKFPNLRKLCLCFGAFVGREMIIKGTGFVNLEYLEFRNLPNLEKWRVQDGGAMRQLSALTIRRCPKLEKIPDGLASISTLRIMEIELAAKALPDGQEAEYRRKFHFVRSLIIRKLDPFAAT
ncbi:Apoptotic ATPase [Handroanthus impetiginosus]|uniref:Apoptotic ATPase n=1 Tax=Handroanthus impetiginosus TaxID=429701 RepID=A0A2G9I3F5_9LAMI|nr:Apoptotic ATPase [Handroanthus impetiginosus]